MSKRIEFKIFKSGFIHVLGNGKVIFYTLEQFKEISDLYHSVIDRACFGDFNDCPIDDECKIKDICYHSILFTNKP